MKFLGQSPNFKDHTGISSFNSPSYSKSESIKNQVLNPRYLEEKIAEESEIHDNS